MQAIQGFNSKLVRLKDHQLMNQSTNNNKFQFQIGAIKSIPLRLTISLAFLFQFQIGAIKRLYWTSGNIHTFDTFQFQIGAIKRFDSLGRESRVGGFNSKLVRLKDCGRFV